MDKLNKAFIICVSIWTAFGIGMVYSTSIFPLWVAFVVLHAIMFVVSLTLATRLFMRNCKRYLREQIRNDTI